MRRGLEELAPPPTAPVSCCSPPARRARRRSSRRCWRRGWGSRWCWRSELTVREGRVWQRTLGGAGRLEPVDVILRRVDAALVRPARPAPGLPPRRARAAGGRAAGHGSGRQRARQRASPRTRASCRSCPPLAEALLDEPLALPGAPTWWCGDPAGPLARPRPDGRPAGQADRPRRRARHAWTGPRSRTAERAELAARIEAEPHAWIGQEPQRQSTAPVVAADGALDARPLVLRTFAVAAGGAFRVLRAGWPRRGRAATTVAKDVWVSRRDRHRARRATRRWRSRGRRRRCLSPRVAADLFWLGRYAERAEGTARLLRAVADRFADFRSTPEPAGGEALAVLLRAATAVTDTPGRAPPCTRLITDRDLPGTLAYAVHRLTRRGAGRARTAVHRHLAGAGAAGVRARRGGLGRAHGADVSARAFAACWRACSRWPALPPRATSATRAGTCIDAGRRVERAQHVAALVAATLCEPGLPAADGLVAGVGADHRRERRSPTAAAGAPASTPCWSCSSPTPTTPGRSATRPTGCAQDVAHVPGPDGGVLTALVAVERRLAGLPARRPRPPSAPTAPATACAARSLGLGEDLTRFAEVLEGARFAPGAAACGPLGPVAVIGGGA